MPTLAERNLAKETTKLQARLSKAQWRARQANVLLTEAQDALTASNTLMASGTPAVGDEDAWTAQMDTNTSVIQKRTSR